MTVTREAVSPRKPFSGEPLGGSVAERLARLPDIVAALRRDDPAAERDRVLQYEAVEAIRQTGVLGLRVPTEFGGPGGKVRDVLSAVIQIGRGSSNVAQALRSHFGFSERLLSNRATPEERAEWYPRVNAGIVVGNAITDAAGRAPSSADTKVLPDTAGVLRLNGYKFYSTGTLFADVIAVSALDAAWSLTCRPSFRRTGPESNCSTTGTVSVSARPPAAERASPTSRSIPDEVVTVSDGNTLGHSTAFLQLYLASVAVGIAYAVLDDAVEYVRTKARPASHSVADSAATDPFVLQAVGEISAAASSGEAVVLAAADAIDRLVDQGRQHDSDAVADVAVDGGQGAAGGRTVDDLGRRAALRHRRRFGNSPRAQSRPALAQRAHIGRPQPAGVQGLCGRQLRRQRDVAARQRLLLRPQH